MTCAQCPYYMEIARCIRHGTSGDCLHPTCHPRDRFKVERGGCCRAPSKVAAQWAKDCKEVAQ